MPTTMVATPLGDSLRAIADLVDQAPALEGARTAPNVPQSILVGVRTGLIVRALAHDFGVTANTSVDDEHDTLHTHFEVGRGEAVLRVYSIEELPRELRRPTTVTERIEAHS